MLVGGGLVQRVTPVAFAFPLFIPDAGVVVVLVVEAQDFRSLAFSRFALRLLGVAMTKSFRWL